MVLRRQFVYKTTRVGSVVVSFKPTSTILEDQKSKTKIPHLSLSRRLHLFPQLR